MITTNKVPILYLVGKIKIDLLWVVVIVIVTEVLLYFFSDIIPKMPWNVPAFMGTAISILLSFKMAQSYERWWEARKIWGAIVNDSRSLVLQLFQFCENDKYFEKIKQIGQYQIAWCYELAGQLKTTPNHDKLEQLTGLSKQTIASIKHIPLWINRQQVSKVKSLRSEDAIDGFAHMQIDATLTRLIESMGKAERIKNTVFPSSYRYILHISIYTFLVMSSIAMKDIDLTFHIPLLFIMACIFFWLEKSSFTLQDPFDNHITDTPVYSISETIEGNIKELLGESFETSGKYKKSYYQL